MNLSSGLGLGLLGLFGCQHNVHQMKCHTEVYSSEDKSVEGAKVANSNSLWLERLLKRL